MNKNNSKQQELKSKKQIVGKVVSVGMHKSIVVEIDRIYRHPIYKKALRRTRRFLVHSELTGIAVGDYVRIEPSRPISKRKHFIVIAKVSTK